VESWAALYIEIKLYTHLLIEHLQISSYSLFFLKKEDKTKNINFIGEAKNRFSRTVPLDFK
jgi:hypothetical protein